MTSRRCYSARSGARKPAAYVTRPTLREPREERFGRARRGILIGAFLFFVELSWLAGSIVLAGAVVDVDRAVAAAPVDSKSRKNPKTWHATAYVRGGSMGIRVIDYWSKGPSMRARTLIGGHPILTLIHDGRYVAIDELTGKGVSIRRPPGAIALDKKRVRPFAFELDDLLRDGGEKIEDFEIGVMPAEIWQVRDARGRRKIWVSASEPRVPLRIETFSRAAGETLNLDYSNWTFDIEMRDGFFRPPAGVELDMLDYDAYSAKAADGSVTPVPILYPDLLHGLAAQ